MKTYAITSSLWQMYAIWLVLERYRDEVVKPPYRHHRSCSADLQEDVSHGFFIAKETETHRFPPG